MGKTEQWAEVMDTWSCQDHRNVEQVTKVELQHMLQAGVFQQIFILGLQIFRTTSLEQRPREHVSCLPATLTVSLQCATPCSGLLNARQVFSQCKLVERCQAVIGWISILGGLRLLGMISFCTEQYWVWVCMHVLVCVWTCLTSDPEQLPDWFLPRLKMTPF